MTRVIFYSSALILFLCFLAQAIDIFTKFFAGKTTTAISTEHHDKVEYPVLTFCPGFNQTFAREFNVSKGAKDIFHFYPEKEEITDTELSDWWNMYTLNISDHLIHARMYPPSEESQQNEIIETEVFSTFGKCWSLSLKHSVNSAEALALRFDSTMLGNIGLYIHNPGYTFLGLNYNYWPVPINFVRLDSGASTTVTLDKIRNIKPEGKNEACMPEVTEEKYVKCLKDWTQGQYIKQSKEVNMTACQYPAVLDVVGDLNLPVCQTKITMKQMDTNFWRIMSQTNKKSATGCVKPCTTTTFKMSLKENIFVNIDNQIFVYIEMPNTDITIIEEFVIFDFNSIVSSVGGSMGLFLGFSGLEVVRMILDKWKGVNI